MAEGGEKKSSWCDFFEMIGRNSQTLDEPEKETEETTETKEEGAHGKAENPDTPDEPSTSSEIEVLDVEHVPLVDTNTGHMYKLYEILMIKLGIEIPELKDENLSDLEKELRQRKKTSMVMFEVKRDRELGMTPKQILERATFICTCLTRKAIPIKMTRSVACSKPRTSITKVKFWSLEDKKEVFAKRHFLNKSRVKIDHELTSIEISLQSELLKLWRKKESQKDHPLTIPDKICVNNKWYTVQTVSQPSTESN